MAHGDTGSRQPPGVDQHSEEHTALGTGHCSAWQTVIWVAARMAPIRKINSSRIIQLSISVTVSLPRILWTGGFPYKPREILPWVNLIPASRVWYSSQPPTHVLCMEGALQAEEGDWPSTVGPFPNCCSHLSTCHTAGWRRSPDSLEIRLIHPPIHFQSQVMVWILPYQ